MILNNIDIKAVVKNPNLKSKFYSGTNNNLEIDCNILCDNFYLDSYNYFPITQDYYTFFEIFNWGDKLKYDVFDSDDFINNFSKKIKSFKTLSNIYVLGSSSADNYYRNMITFLPRIFFAKDSEINLAIHRNSSNKFRNFIINMCDQMKIKIKFIFLDDKFYKFIDSQMPQFLNKNDSFNILNTLRKQNTTKNERIYISRYNANYRNLINESDVINKLKNIGFRVVDLNNLEIDEQIELFSNAKVIVSPTGSSLTNIVFCNPGTKVYEISPQYHYEYEDRFKKRYQDICRALKLEYIRIEADSVIPSKIDNKITNQLSYKALQTSNYYKDLIVKLEKIDELINT